MFREGQFKLISSPVIWVTWEETVLYEVVKPLLVTDPAEVWAGLPAHPDTGVATLQGKGTWLSAELVLTRLTAELKTAEVGTRRECPPEAGLLAGHAGLSTGQTAVGVTTRGLTVPGAEAGQPTPLSAHVAALQTSPALLTTRLVQSGPVTLAAGPYAPVLTLQFHPTRLPADLRPVFLEALHVLGRVAAVQLLVDDRLTPGGGATLVGAVSSTKSECRNVTTKYHSIDLTLTVDTCGHNLSSSDTSPYRRNLQASCCTPPSAGDHSRG